MSVTRITYDRIRRVLLSSLPLCWHNTVPHTYPHRLQPANPLFLKP